MCAALPRDRAKGVYDDLVARIQAQVKEIQIGAQKAEETEMGPIVSDEQRTRIAAFVDRAGTCDVVTGGRAGDGAGYFYEPTLLANVDNNGGYAYPVFGPVVTVSRLRRQRMHCASQTASDYELTSSVWTQNIQPRHADERRDALWLHGSSHGVGTPEMPWAR